LNFFLLSRPKYHLIKYRHVDVDHNRFFLSAVLIYFYIHTLIFNWNVSISSYRSDNCSPLISLSIDMIKKKWKCTIVILNISMMRHVCVISTSQMFLFDQKSARRERKKFYSKFLYVKYNDHLLKLFKSIHNIEGP
jgi:hypothetical protein